MTILTRADPVGSEPYDSIAWAFEVHIEPQFGVGDKNEFHCAILTGNEDAPSRIELWRSGNPHYQAKPDKTYDFEKVDE